MESDQLKQEWYQVLSPTIELSPDHKYFSLQRV